MKSLELFRPPKCRCLSPRRTTGLDGTQEGKRCWKVPLSHLWFLWVLSLEKVIVIYTGSVLFRTNDVLETNDNY